MLPSWDSPGSSLLILSDETGDGSVECPFHFGGEQACGELSKPIVVSYALTASPLPIARFVGTGIIPLIELEIAFQHGFLLSSIPQNGMIPSLKGVLSQYSINPLFQLEP